MGKNNGSVIRNNRSHPAATLAPDGGASGALAGLRVLDCTQVILGPAATQVLADFGADMIKVERPGRADLARTFAPFLRSSRGCAPVSVRYRSVNRNKRDLAVDLRSPAGRELIFRPIQTVDVLVRNFRPSVMESLGLGYEDMRMHNPRLPYAEGSGWGSRGPLPETKKPGQELLTQAFVGLAAKNAGADGLPRALPTNVSDFTASQLLVQGILIALLARERTGQGRRWRSACWMASASGPPPWTARAHRPGQKVEVCLLDGLLALQRWDDSSRLSLGDLDTDVPDHASGAVVQASPHCRGRFATSGQLEARWRAHRCLTSPVDEAMHTGAGRGARC